MKKIIALISIIALTFSCKKNTNKSESNLTNEISIAESIASAHGFENWKNVSEIQFTFNLDRDSSHFSRAWTWKPKTGDVSLITKEDSIFYNRKSIDSTSLQADKAFINDKYWLLAPFQIIWDNVDYISTPLQPAPISKQLMNKITITYSNEGGYTPGDAYDFYFDKDYLIKEWVFRQANSEKPTLITTWENYKEFNGLKICLDHKKAEGNWKLYFTDVIILE